MRTAMPMAALLLAPALAAAQANPAETARAAMQAGNYAEAYCAWRGLAEQGDADAQFNLGWLYHNGYGLVINDREALRWWEHAAAQNHPEAMYALGNLYRMGGREIPKDAARSIGYFLGAAQHGDEDASLLLRSLIARNDAAVRDRAAELLTQHAAALGAPLAVAVEKANVRRGMGADHPTLTVLTQGAPLVELSRRSGWVQVGIPETGQIGWLKGSLVKPAR